MGLSLATEVKFLKGVGPERAALLNRRGIYAVEDLLYYLPFRYENRIQFTPIHKLSPGNVFTVQAEVASGGTVRYRRRAGAVYHLAVRDASGLLHARFFHSPYLEQKLKPGQRIVLHGKVDFDPLRPARLEMINPQFELLGRSPGEDSDSTEVGRIVPIYEAIGSVSSRLLRRILYMTLAAPDVAVPDLLPSDLLARFAFPSRGEALRAAHFPERTADLDALNAFRTPAQLRLIFEEFFCYQLGLALRRQEARTERGIAFRVREEKIRAAVKRILPFKPTAAQKRVLAEIAADLERPAPMNRLLQGDVGCGKTIVALEAATIAMENGCQAALMAPTEILAVQHYLSCRRVCAPGGYRSELLISAMKPAQKRAARARVHDGTAQFVVGTHALLEEGVEFARLGLVIVDEQHRFGVLQRKRLIEKGMNAAGSAASEAVRPHVLVMTATPIPRTLSLTLYGDLDLSVIDEMPPGRTPVVTRATSDDKLAKVWEFVRREAAKGRQAYVVYPVIEESKQELKAATAEYETLRKRVFPELRVGLLHGRLPSEEKEGVMEQFRRGEINILVATSVIEVGVDVPNASVMVIEHAERFGLAQLHQLRGRIGRGSARSYCILVAPAQPGEEAGQRIQTLVETSDGFVIAEKDLQLRGPGEFFGTRQHGEMAFHVAHPLRDHELLEIARHEAFAFAERRAAGSAELDRLLEFLGPRWPARYALATVG